MGKREQKIIETAKRRFDLAITAESENRAMALDDLKFKRGDQWPADIKSQRQLDRRPCITINKMKTFVHQITNEQRQNRPGINVTPVGTGGHKKTAQMLMGWIREVQRSSDADIAYDTGYDDAVSCGYGYWRLLTDYDAHGPGVGINDQHVVIKRIRNRFTVYRDPARQQPDGSDSKWDFITEMIPREEFKEMYPKADQLPWDAVGVGENYKNWADGKNIRIAEYFYLDKATKTLVRLANGHIGYEADLAPEVKAQVEADPKFVIDRREEETHTVKWCKITGKEILEEREWLGQWIPIVECIGDEIDVEGKVTRSGVIRDAKDPQRSYNFCVTAAMEQTALAPKAPFIMAQGQDEGSEEEWNSANQRSYSRLRYNPKSVDGHVLPPPTRSPGPEAPQGWLAMQNAAAQDMMATTGIRFDSTLAERTQDESGIALQRLAVHQQLGSFHYIDNFARALKFTGNILLDLAPKILDTKRMVTILNEDGSERHVMVDPTAPKPYQKIKGEDGKPVEVYNLNLGKYEVTVTIGPSYATKQQEATQGMMEFGKAFPTKAEFIADLVAKNQPWSGSDEIAKRIAMTLPPGMIEPDESDMDPQVQALIRQQQMQLQKQQQALQQMQAALNDKEADRQVDRDKMNLDFEAKMQAIAEKMGATVLTHLRSDLDAIRAAQAPAKGNGAMQ